ncbi:MAG: hypothetical protein Q7T03_00580 [Deltaproteobacteria bacterium]|nr:hypothetical protein [Deltaproteobacteria bacterium]
MNLQPVDGSQLSVVQIVPSLQVILAPLQTPLVQTSPVVQAFTSEQVVPLVTGVKLQTPGRIKLPVHVLLVQGLKSLHWVDDVQVCAEAGTEIKKNKIRHTENTNQRGDNILFRQFIITKSVWCNRCARVFNFNIAELL